LFVGNLPADITDEDFKRLFAKYGEPGEVFINKGKGFGFIKLVGICTICPSPKNVSQIVVDNPIS